MKFEISTERTRIITFSQITHIFTIELIALRLSVIKSKYH